MRDLVADKAAESEQLRTLSPAIVEEMWASGLMSSFNPVEAGGAEPSFAEPDRPRQINRPGSLGLSRQSQGLNQR
jgi:hypothetical protein